MFNRFVDVTVISPIGESTTLVDHTLGVNTLLCSGTIKRYPYTEIDSLVIDIYNLSPTKLGELYANHYFDGGLIKVDFGYEDDGVMHTLFYGNIQRGQLTRPDQVTSVVTIYAFDCGEFVNYGFFGKTYEDGYNMYAIAEQIMSDNNVTNYQLTEKLKNYTTNGTKTYSGSADTYLKQIAQDCGLYYKKENMLLSIISPEDGSEEEVTYFTTKTDGKVTSMSGLIGIPQLDNDGLDFECLINPNLSIYGIIYIDNSIISIEQSGAIPSASLGATLSSNGMYRITNMTTTFNNHNSQAKTHVKALAKDFYDNYTTSKVSS